MKQGGCGIKKTYSKHQAKRAKQWVGRRRDKDIRIYECPDCHGYHLTKRNYD